jgi:hypothetical protein
VVVVTVVILMIMMSIMMHNNNNNNNNINNNCKLGCLAEYQVLYLEDRDVLNVMHQRSKCSCQGYIQLQTSVCP